MGLPCWSVLRFGLSVCLIHMGFQGSTLLEGSVTLGTWINLSEFQYPHLGNGVIVMMLL